ncbi:hydrophobe/amphiphile efflux-1 family RND transporter, partial [Herbaspirillum sp. HC18]
ALAAEVEGILKTESAIADYSTVIGLNFIDNYSQPNAGFFVVTLKPFDQRTSREESASAVIARLAQKFRAVRAGNVVPIAPPPIIGLGSGGGFSYVLMDMGSADPKALGHALRGLTVAANQEPQLRRVFSTFS